MKRSRALKLRVMALTVPLGLAGCGQDDSPRELVVESVDQCVSTGQGTREECWKGYDMAFREHENTAPQFADAKTCEAQFGQCEQRNEGGMSWMPVMAGFAVGYLARGFNGSQRVDCQATPNAPGCRGASSSGGTRGFVSTRPLYRNRAGEFASVNGESLGARSGMSAPARASTIARGGFGAHGSGRGG